jgi:integrase
MSPKSDAARENMISKRSTAAIVARRSGPAARNYRAPQLKIFARTSFLPYIDAAPLDSDTRRYYRNGWRLLSSTPIAKRRLNEIKAPDAEILRFPGNGSNANCALRTLRRMLSLAREWDLLPKVPRVRMREENQRSAVFSSGQEAALLAVARQPLRDFFLILQDSGLRPDETLRMRWENILWDKDLIFNPDGKTRQSRRYVPLSDRVRAVLKARAASLESEWVFPSPRKRGAHISYFPIARDFSKARKAAGLPRSLVLYSARHSFATDVLDRTGNVILVQRLLGHESPTSVQRYVHPEIRAIAGVINLRNEERSAHAGAAPEPQNC